MYLYILFQFTVLYSLFYRVMQLLSYRCGTISTDLINFAIQITVILLLRSILIGSDSILKFNTNTFGSRKKKSNSR